MELLVSTICHSTPQFRVNLCKYEPCQLQWRLPWRVHHQIYPKCSRKVIMAQMDKPNKVSVQLGIVKDRLWEAVPETVKDFPWKKAQVIVLERLVSLGHKALKWSLAAFFVLIVLPDCVFSISRNRELMIPFGLLLGCLMSDFLRDTLQEMFSRSEGICSHRHLLSIGCFFVVLRFVTAYFPLKVRIFLLLVADGGLIQVMWLWRCLVEKKGNGSGVHSI